MSRFIQDLRLSNDSNLIKKAKLIDLAFESKKKEMVREYSDLVSRRNLCREILVTILYEKADTLITVEKDRWVSITNSEEAGEDVHLLTGS